MSSKSSERYSSFFDTVVPLLRREFPKWKTPIVTEMAQREKNPFKVLISTIISLRTKDEVTSLASKRLFAIASTPSEMVKVSEKKIGELIYPAGFYKTKAVTIIDVCRRLVDEFGGIVPDSLDILLSFKGVGRKTANLVLTQGFGLPGICVDTHVHRITNRFGIIKTKDAEETEFRLREILPAKYWIEYNDLLVAFGQNHCKPISPICSTCKLNKICEKKGVETSR
ncbi:MAG: endonuclease III [Fibrobacteres bacterium]|nr:endonuclease III [Fibrobacterota bacterium]